MTTLVFCEITLIRLSFRKKDAATAFSKKDCLTFAATPFKNYLSKFWSYFNTSIIG